MAFNAPSIFVAIVSIAFLLADAEAATCSAQSSSDCLAQAQLTVLKTIYSNDNRQYCVQATLALVQVGVCLTNCSFSVTADITTAQINLNTFCATAVFGANCTNITVSYNNYLMCFASVSGASTLASAVLSNFNAGNSTNSACQNLFSARSCQKVYIDSCTPYLGALDTIFQMANPTVGLALAACGSEAVPQINLTAGCVAGLSALIQTQCNIACSLYNAPDNPTICRLLQTQADCIASLSSTCTSAQAQYLLPRFSSYALANLNIGCSVKVFGLLVQPRNQITCDYVTQINTCFYLKSAANAINYFYFLQIIDRDMPVGGFCKNKSSSLLAACSQASLTCVTPHEKLYVTPTTFDDSFAPLIGVFPLNIWGTQSVLTWLMTSTQCAARSPWIDPVCSPLSSSSSTTTTTTATSANMNSENNTPVRTRQNTPSQNQTPQNPNGVGNIRDGVTPPTTSG